MLFISDTTVPGGWGECFSAVSVKNKICQIITVMMQRAEDAMQNFILNQSQKCLLAFPANAFCNRKIWLQLCNIIRVRKCKDYYHALLKDKS